MPLPPPLDDPLQTIDVQPTNISLAQQEAAKTATGESVPEQLNWNVMESKIRKLVADWSAEIRETKRRRAIRKLDINTASLRTEGKLLADETLIGVRVCDENIRKEQPIFVQYLTQPHRLAVFDCQTTPTLNTENLETAFTKGMSYSGFLRNLFKCVDGAQTHAWDSVEILFDSSKPLHCGVEHIGHENLIFSDDSKDIQSQEFILRGFDLTTIQLQRFKKKHGFSPQVVDQIVEDIKATTSSTPKNIRCYKYFTKIDDIVYVAWCTLRGDTGDGGQTVSGWLKEPKPLDLGRKSLEEKTVMQEQQVPVGMDAMGAPMMAPTMVPVKTKEWVSLPEEQYPIKLYLYSESEEQCITDQKGRVFYDLPFQEAQIALRSLFINGAVRASNVYAAPAQPSQTGGALRKMDNVALEHGVIYSEPMVFFHADYPDPNILRAADSLDVRKAQEMGRSAEAVINRDDSRKTAEELKQAKDETLQLGTIPIMMFSGFMREVLSVAWYIVQSQAEQNLITIMPLEIPVPGPVMDPAAPPKTITINDPTFIQQAYDIKPAGDIDVVRRAEKVQRRLVLLPIIQPTAAYPQFLMDLITEMLPEDAAKYNQILQQQQVNQQQIMIGLAGMLREATTDDQGNIMPEWQKFAPQLQQAFSMLDQVQGAGNQPAGQNNAKSSNANT